MCISLYAHERLVQVPQALSNGTSQGFTHGLIFLALGGMMQLLPLLSLNPIKSWQIFLK